MRVESYERQIAKTCRRCFTIFDLRRRYCCVKGRDECFADISLVRKGIQQDSALRMRLYRNKAMTADGGLTCKRFFRGRVRNECLVFDYRPPGCRSYFCGLWDSYIRDSPRDFVDAAIEVASTSTLMKELEKEFEFGTRMAYPGGFIIFTGRTAVIRKELSSLFKRMGIPSFVTKAGKMDPETNAKEGVEIIVDDEEALERPGLFGTLINNNVFMLVRIKMNMGSTGFSHSNIFVTDCDPGRIAAESSASLRSFHAMKAFAVQ